MTIPVFDHIPSTSKLDTFGADWDDTLSKLNAWGAALDALGATAAADADTATTQAGTATTQAGDAAASAAAASAGASTATTQAGLATTNGAAQVSLATSQAVAAAASAASAAAVAGAFVGTSTTSLTIGTGTAKVFTTQAGEQYTDGVYMTAVSVANSANWMFGQVTYSGTTLTMTPSMSGGSGTHADWNLSISGPAGPAGAGVTADTTGFHVTAGAIPKTLAIDVDLQASLVAQVAASQAEMEAGTETALRTMTPARVKQAITALSPPSPEILTPTNTSPANAATGQAETPTLTGSTFYSNYGATHAATQVRVNTTSDFTTPLYSSGDQAASTSFTLPSGLLVVSETVYWEMRYKNSRGTYSDWSAAFSLQTAAAFNSYIATPTATPAAFGDPFEGGFYSGMFWNELIQSSTSQNIATVSGNITFVVSSGAAYAYAGQVLEARSRANPANKIIGTVAGANLTTLILTVTGTGGSGTCTDWSIMSKYRNITAPKSTESSSLAYKNANTDAPAACQTLTEGLKATLAMIAAGDATVYPAAWYCHNLTTGGKSDWHLPARDQRELEWRNLKPGTDNNSTTGRPDSAINYTNLGSFDDTDTLHGHNLNSSPVGAAYSTTVPAQVAAGKNFRTGESEAFTYGSYVYWSASEYSATNSWLQYWHSGNPGGQNYSGKTDANYVRAVRRSII